LPYALYLSRQTIFKIDALTDGLEIATCWVSSDEDHPVQLITPSDCEVELRGGGNASRQIRVLDGNTDATSIVALY
jgi:5-deoxy-glucuronate isomerase